MPMAVQLTAPCRKCGTAQVAWPVSSRGGVESGVFRKYSCPERQSRINSAFSFRRERPNMAAQNTKKESQLDRIHCHLRSVRIPLIVAGLHPSSSPVSGRPNRVPGARPRSLRADLLQQGLLCSKANNSQYEGQIKYLTSALFNFKYNFKHSYSMSSVDRPQIMQYGRWSTVL